MGDAFERAAERADAEQRRRQQERSARGQRIGFLIHLRVYEAVQALLVAVWGLQRRSGGTRHPWFLYPLLGWGAGVAAHHAVARDSLNDTQDMRRTDD